MTQHWYTLHTKPYKEEIVHQFLLSKGVRVFYPNYKTASKKGLRLKITPWFPRYMFVSIDLITAGKNALKWIPGAHGLVTFGEEPGIVPNQFIAKLSEQLSKLDVGNSSCTPQQGNKVCIIDGPLSGYEAVFDKHLPGKNRVQVFLNFFGQYNKKIQLNLSSIHHMTDSK